jgi:hypothetical protein
LMRINADLRNTGRWRFPGVGTHTPAATHPASRQV